MNEAQFGVTLVADWPATIAVCALLTAAVCAAVAWFRARAKKERSLLTQSWRTHRLSFDEATALLSNVSDELCALHRESRVHGCVCPSCIITKANSGARLCKNRSNRARSAEDVPFLSPEALTQRRLLTQSDVYSYAAVLVMLITDDRMPDAYERARRDTVLRTLKKSGITPLQRRALFLALSLDASERPRTMDEFLKLFEQEDEDAKTT